MTSKVFQPEMVWLDGGFDRGKSITVEDGIITSIGEATSIDAGTAFLPGFINAHSHAFQRGLRGMGEIYTGEGNDSFWGWRADMYKVVEQLSVDTFRNHCEQAFLEMRHAGITTVGEFHYVHHGNDQDYALDEIVLEAAATIGIRIVLLQACYMHGGIGLPMTKEQQRFATCDLQTWWEQLDALASRVDNVMQRIGTVAHSIRAVDLKALIEISSGALHRGMPMHIHVEEQRQEIAECVEQYGKTPMALLSEELDVTPMMTAVHCTHTAAKDMDQWLQQGGNVCLCPLTEANLADGISDLRRILKQGGCVSLGTDSNARISMIEEMRWMEYVQRLAHEERGVCVDAAGNVAACLIDAATINGARSLGVPAGTIEVGKFADFTVIDLAHPQLEGVTKTNVAAAICFGADNSIITRTIVAGE